MLKRIFAVAVRILAVAVLTLGCRIAYTESRQSTPPIPSTRTAIVQVAPRHLPEPAIPAIVPEKTIDQLLDEVERLRLQKAELEKREQELVKDIRSKLEKQTGRVTKLDIVELAVKAAGGIVPAAQLPALP